MPEWVVDLPGSSRLGDNQGVAGSVAFFDENLLGATKAPKKVEVTVYAVDKAGKRKKVGKKKGSIKKGEVDVVFRGLAAPGDHFQLEAKLNGGKASAGEVWYQASLADLSGLSRARSSSRPAAPHRVASVASVSSRGVILLETHTVSGSSKAPAFTADILPTNLSTTDAKGPPGGGGLHGPEPEL